MEEEEEKKCFCLPGVNLYFWARFHFQYFLVPARDLLIVVVKCGIELAALKSSSLSTLTQIQSKIWHHKICGERSVVSFWWFFLVPLAPFVLLVSWYCFEYALYGSWTGFLVSDIKEHVQHYWIIKSNFDIEKKNWEKTLLSHLGWKFKTNFIPKS